MSINAVSGNTGYLARTNASSQSCQQNQNTSSSSAKRSQSSESVTVDFSTLAMLLQSAQSGQSGSTTTEASQSSSFSLSGIGGAMPLPPPGGMKGPGMGEPPPFEEMDQALADLSSALESGDIDAAKAAFETFQSLAPQPPPDAAGSAGTSSTGESSETAASTFSDKLAALSNALDSGDTEAAQSAYEALMEDIEAHKPDEGMQARQRQQYMNNYLQMAMLGSSTTTATSTISTST